MNNFKIIIWKEDLFGTYIKINHENLLKYGYRLKNEKK